jgi:hypothetical protein
MLPERICVPEATTADTAPGRRFAELSSAERWPKPA